MLRCLTLFAVMLTATGPAVAQQWPERTIRFIVSQSPGNSTDTIARLLADRLTTRLGQTVVVENRPGGGNVVGAQAAARAAADGYTFFLATAAALVTDPYTFKSLPYDPMKDFVPVARVADVHFMIMANPKLPANNLDELIALAKSQPGKLTIATAGHRRFSGMIVAWLNKLAGTQILQVPYTVQSQSIQDAIGGQVDLVILGVPPARSLAASGRLRPLAITSLKRAPEFPDVAAIAERFAGFDFTGWQLLAAPSGTPAGVLARMNSEVGAILADPALLAMVRKMAFDIPGAGSLNPAQDYVNNQYATWGKVVREIGVTPQ
jgi:tripartite-type tricarboxylate transporter receptor subunit TctC